MGSPGEDAVLAVLSEPVLQTSVASTGLLSLKMRRRFSFCLAPSVVSSEIEFGNANYVLPEKAIAAAFLEALADLVMISGI